MNRYTAVFGHELPINETTIKRAHRFLLEQSSAITCLVNAVRLRYRDIFETQVELATEEQVREAIEGLFMDKPLAINLAALLQIAFALRGTEDYEVFVIDELLGSSIAEVIAGDEPSRAFATANFHVIDVMMKKSLAECFEMEDDRQLAVDDALAGVGAGLEAILPGWDWMDRRRVRG